MAMRKTYVEFYYPGLLVAEVSTPKPVESKHVLPQVPDNAWGYRFFETEEVEVQTELGIKVLKSEPFNYSGITYIDAEILTLDEVRAKFPQKDILISNMEANHWGKVVRCRTGNFQPFTDKDRVIANPAKVGGQMW